MPFAERTRASSLEEVLAVLRAGADHLEDPPRRFTLLDHHLQCAATLAARYPEDRELQVAGLLHDIGHTLLPDAPDEHAGVAQAFLEPVFGNRLAELVGLHVEAKRYLVATEPGYRAQLSMGSAETLVAQGEALTQEEVVAFRAHPRAEDAVALRRADEAGKLPGVPVPALEEWLPLLTGLAAGTCP